MSSAMLFEIMHCETQKKDVDWKAEPKWLFDDRFMSKEQHSVPLNLLRPTFNKKNVNCLLFVVSLNSKHKAS